MISSRPEVEGVNLRKTLFIYFSNIVSPFSHTLSPAVRTQTDLFCAAVGLLSLQKVEHSSDEKRNSICKTKIMSSSLSKWSPLSLREKGRAKDE